MMDGRVAAIRSALDANGFLNTPILSYAAKFAPDSTVHSARPPIRRRRSVTGAPTR